jgi:hypothetical protein
MRNRISTALVEAQKQQNKGRVAALRLINAAIQDRDIANRGKGKDKADDAEIADILQKMIKQREESARLYAQGGRAELEAQELAEIGIIREFLPTQLSEAQTADAVTRAIAETGAAGIRDMGKVMAFLKDNYRGQIDMAKAGVAIKAALAG